MTIFKKTENSQDGGKKSFFHGFRFATGDGAKLPTKRTLNLCVKERSGLPAELFLFILATALVFIIIVEFFGIYKPYSRIEALEKELSAYEDRIDQKKDSMADFKDLTEKYDRYNFDSFDRSIADYLDVLAILDREIFAKEGFDARMPTLTISGKAINLSINGLSEAQVSELHKNLLADPLIEDVNVSVTGNTNGVSYVTIQITLADASTVSSQGGN